MFSYAFVISLDNIDTILVFEAVSHRVPKVYYIYIFTCSIQSDESNLFGSPQFYTMFSVKRKTRIYKVKTRGNPPTLSFRVYK